jgi:hypothetical protein
MSSHEFDTLAAGERDDPVAPAAAGRHLALLERLIDDPEWAILTDDDLNEVEQLAAGQRAVTSMVGRTAQRKISRRAAIVVASVVALAAAGVGTAAAFGLFSKPTDRSIGHCYTAADLNAAHNDFALASSPGAESGDAAGYALDICQRDWGNGRLRINASQIGEPDPGGARYPVPSLAVCVLESGQVGVFPGDQNTCRILGLTIADLR